MLSIINSMSASPVGGHASFLSVKTEANFSEKSCRILVCFFRQRDGDYFGSLMLDNLKNRPKIFGRFTRRNVDIILIILGVAPKPCIIIWSSLASGEYHFYTVLHNKVVQNLELLICT